MGTITNFVSGFMTFFSLTLGLLYVFSGLMKLTPSLDEATYRKLRKMFVSYAHVFPLADTLGLQLDPHMYRTVVGMTEVVSGMLLGIFQGRLKQLANIVLLVLMIGAMYSHTVLGDALQQTAPAIVLAVLLISRLWIVRLLERREQHEALMTEKRSR